MVSRGDVDSSGDASRRRGWKGSTATWDVRWWPASDDVGIEEVPLEGRAAAEDKAPQHAVGGELEGMTAEPKAVASTSSSSRARSLWRKLRRKLSSSSSSGGGGGDNAPRNVERSRSSIQNDTESTAAAAAVEPLAAPTLVEAERRSCSSPMPARLVRRSASDSDCLREEAQARRAREWSEEILPHWERKANSKRTRELLLAGVPSKVRGHVWPLLIGNELHIAPGLYDVLCEEARESRRELQRETETLSAADGDLGGAGGQAEEVFTRALNGTAVGACPASQKAIVLDLPRTFPELGFFHAADSPFQEQLRQLLEAYAHFRPEFGYSQGMSYLAAVLLLYLDASHAFACFVNMLARSHCLSAFYKMQTPDVRAYLLLQKRLLVHEMPTLATHFHTIGIEPDMYLIGWIMTLYCRVLPIDTALRIWDCFFWFGDPFIFRAAIGILRVLEPRLLAGSFEDCAYMLSHLPAVVTEEALMKAVRAVRFSPRRFYELFDTCMTLVSAAPTTVHADVAGDMEEGGEDDRADPHDLDAPWPSTHR